MIDESTAFGARAAAHLRDDTVIWLTTAGASGAPLPTIVWFLWDGAGSVLVYSRNGAARLRHIETNPRVALNFAGDGKGGDVVVISGEAAVDPDAPGVAANPDYLAKYAAGIERIGSTPERFARDYSTALRIRVTKVRGH
jgi:PPOX class probable F420-dependent enzyme